MNNQIRINTGRLTERLSDLAKIGGLKDGGVSRLALTEDDREGRNLVVNWMKELGMTITVDMIGNVVARRPGKTDAPPVMMGSHIDTVTVAGPYDGCLGVLAGLEIIETLNENHIETELPLAVAFFTNEEGSRFQPDMMGSLVYTGQMPLNEALGTFGIYRANVGDCLKRIGYAGKDPVGNNKLSAFFELHIEQGPVLEREGIDIGVVESVQGISWCEVVFEGKSCHAGYYPMNLRNDPGYAAAQVASYARTITTELGKYQVATIGRMEVYPGLVNVCPNKVVMTVDMRNPDEADLQQAERMLEDYIKKVCNEEGVRYSKRSLARFKPTFFNKDMVNRVENNAQKLGYSTKRMHSTAGHDAQIIASICPAAMVFVPCVDGISHNVKEMIYKKDIEAGANTLLNVVLDTARPVYKQDQNKSLIKQR
jgi:N-carbamoyl-L-amino-acid hydrolase